MRSYGNSWTHFPLLSEGGMTLLVGEVGAGKSTISDSIDFGLWGKVRGSDSGVAKLKGIGNYYNQTGEVFIEVYAGGYYWEIHRTLNPSKLIVKRDGIVIDLPSITQKQEMLEQAYGISYTGWRSFVNVSFIDFKNFISLSLKDKRELIDKLFEFDLCNRMLMTARELKKEKKSIYDKQHSVYETSMQTYNSILHEKKVWEIKKNEAEQQKKEALEKWEFNKSVAEEKYKRDLEEYNIQIKKNNDDAILKCETEIKEIKDQLYLLKNDNILIDTKLEEISLKIEKGIPKYEELSTHIQVSKKELVLHESGECPTCKRPFESKGHVDELSESIKKNSDKYKKMREILEGLQTEKQTLQNKKLQNEKKISLFKERGKSIQEKIKMYREPILNIPPPQPPVVIQAPQFNEYNAAPPFDKLAEDAYIKAQEANSISEEYISDIQLLQILEDSLGENGIRSDFMSNIIPLLNEEIAKWLDCLECPYSVEFTPEMDAKIQYATYNSDTEASIDNMSGGEMRKANLAVLLSFLQIMYLKNPVNILFLDEVFSNIDIVSIRLIINQFKEFSIQHGLNTILVHHSVLDEDLFDQILRVEKEMFSELIKQK